MLGSQTDVVWFSLKHKCTRIADIMIDGMVIKSISFQCSGWTSKQNLKQAISEWLQYPTDLQVSKSSENLNFTFLCQTKQYRPTCWNRTHIDFSRVTRTSPVSFQLPLGHWLTCNLIATRCSLIPTKNRESAQNHYSAQFVCWRKLERLVRTVFQQLTPCHAQGSASVMRSVIWSSFRPL